ncbi:pyridoxal phosphate-dependent aminotransferase [Candidatus Roizmanbacteria bacterium]|nr:pyridoxal phosphate-dependent aminotransferase [Candidatus Roizmanbacteria bacterium]
MKGLNILKINEKAENASGCIRFDKGSGKFPFPEEFLPFVDQVKKKISGRYFHNPKTGGEIDLKKEIVKLEKRNNRLLDLDNITITHGGMSGLFTFFSCNCAPGDEVVTNSSSFEGFSTICDYFKLNQKRASFGDIKQVEKIITKKTKVIIINSPENPTGKVYTRKEISDLIDLAVSKKIFILSDEVMNKIIYEGTIWYGPSIKNKNVVVVNSFSKTWFIPGIRLGWLATTDNKLTEKFNNSLVSQSIGVSLFSQLLMMDICKKINYQSFLKKRLKILTKRKNLVKEYLKKYKIEYFQEINGGMNYYINLKQNSSQLISRIFNKDKIALIPGYLFEGKESTYARLGFGAVSEEEIKKGIKKIADYL